jgi:CubicO group peptidase (beta-lactamase class C family)
MMLLLCTTLLAAPATPARGPAPSDDLAPDEVVEGELGFRLDEFLTRLEGLGFSGIVGVEYEGVPILIRGYGLAERERDRSVTPATVFCTGSITKQFTAAAILALAEEQKLAVTDPLARHFERVPTDKAGVTLHHLLTHTSGLVDPPAGDYDLRATKEWVRDWALGCTLEFEPGAGYAYRNVNFSLLAMVVERASGKPFETYLEERLFERAGMARTGYRLPDYAAGDFAIGYKDGERWGTTLGHAQLADGPCWTLRGNGGIQATVGDMLRWHHALQEDRVLSAASRARLETPFADEGGGTHYGYGWSIQRSPSGKKLVAHNGGNTVFFADFLRFVEEGHCIFLATNVGSRTSPDLAYDLAGILHGRPARSVPETIERDREWLGRYAGRYALEAGSELELLNLGDRLLLTGSGSRAEELLLEEPARAQLEAARAEAARVARGEDEALLERYRGFQTPASIRGELAEARARWTKRLGAFHASSAAWARPSARETRTVVELSFERGQAFLASSRRPDGSVFAFECLDEPPFRGLPRVELFPLSAEEFAAYDDRRGLGLRMRFELDDAGRATGLELHGNAAGRL